MLKKGLIAAVIFFVGVTLKGIKAEGHIIWSDSLFAFAVGFVVFTFKEWVEVPYDWDKHKNKNKEQKDLG